VDSPRENQGRQIGGYLCSSGSRGGPCVMVLLNMRGANQIWGIALVADCGREDTGRRRQYRSSTLAWKHEQSLSRIA